MQNVSGFVHDGYGRAYEALEPHVRAEVEEEYAQRLARAGFWRRWWFRQLMEGEIERRIHQKAPPAALY